MSCGVGIASRIRHVAVSSVWAPLKFDESLDIGSFD